MDASGQALVPLLTHTAATRTTVQMRLHTRLLVATVSCGLIAVASSGGCGCQHGHGGGWMQDAEREYAENKERKAVEDPASVHAEHRHHEEQGEAHDHAHGRDQRLDEHDGAKRHFNEHHDHVSADLSGHHQHHERRHAETDEDNATAHQCSHGHHHGHSHHHSDNGASAHRFFTKLVSQVLEAVPWVTIGILVTAVLSVFPLSVEYIQSLLGYDTHASFLTQFGIFVKASFVGLVTPLCSCGALPIAAGLVQKGAPLSSVVSFLTASQSAGLDSAAITWGLLGPQAAACRIAGAVVLSVATGLSLLSVAKTSNRSAGANVGSSGSSASPNNAGTPHINPAVLFLESCVETAGEVLPSVLVGLTLSTAVVHAIPSLAMTYGTLTESSTDEVLRSPVAQAALRILVLLSALPLQLCEHSTVTFAAAIQRAGGSPGLAFAFLMAAPSTNLASLLLLSSSSPKTDWTVLPRVASAIVGSALVLSYLVDASGIDLLVEQEARAGGGSGMMDLPYWYVENAKWLCLAFGVPGIGQRLYNTVTKQRHNHDDCGCDGTAKTDKAKCE